MRMIMFYELEPMLHENKVSRDCNNLNIDIE